MERAIAALSFFTRLPLWRVKEIGADAYKRVVELWPLAGWVTGSVAGGVYFAASFAFGPMIAAVMALSSRLLLTGALHEDGLADFADGFGGGTDRDRILNIMKDSHIGSYGVITLIIYFLLAVGAIASMPPAIGAVAILASDSWSKAVASWIINFLPYARSATTAKNRLVYSRMSPSAATVGIIIGAIPLILLPGPAAVAAVAPIVVTGLMIIYLRHKIGGYTGDCCGATFLLSELAMLLAVCAMLF